MQYIYPNYYPAYPPLVYPWGTVYPSYDGLGPQFIPSYAPSQYQSEPPLLHHQTSLPTPPSPPTHIHSTVDSHVSAHPLLRVPLFQSREYIKRRSYLAGWVTFNNNTLPYRQTHDIYSFNSFTESIFILDASVYPLLFRHPELMLHAGLPPPHSFGAFELCSARYASTQDQLYGSQKGDERRPGMYATSDLILDGQPILVERPALIAPYLFPINDPEYQEEVYRGIWSRLELSTSSPSSLQLKHGLRRIAAEWRSPQGEEQSSGSDCNGWKVLYEVLALKGIAIKLDVPNEGPHSELELHRAVFLQAGMCNRSSRPNARCDWNAKTLSLSLHPLRPIRNGEEITIAYQGISCTNPSFSLRINGSRAHKQRGSRGGDNCNCLNCALAFVNVSPSNASVPPPANADAQDLSYVAPLSPSSAPTSPSGFSNKIARTPHPSPHSGHRYLIYATGGAPSACHDSPEEIGITILDDKNANCNRSPSPSSPYADSSSFDGVGTTHDLLTPDDAEFSSDNDEPTNVDVGKLGTSPLTIAAATAGLPTFKEWLGNPDIHDYTLIEFHLRELKRIEREELHELDCASLSERLRKQRLSPARNRDSIDSAASSSRSSRRRSSSSNSSRSSSGSGGSTSGSSSRSTTTSNTTVASEDSLTSPTATDMSTGFPITTIRTKSGVARGAKARAEARQVHTEAIAMCFGALGHVAMFQYWAALVVEGKLRRAGVKVVDGDDKDGFGVTKDKTRAKDAPSAPSLGLVDMDEAQVVRRWIDAPATFPLWGKKMSATAKNAVEEEIRRE